MKIYKKVMLIIMDGWGKGLGDKSDAIAAAKTPFVDSLYKLYPHSELITYGESVGLPAGQMGNSEVGHLNIGAGRIVYQDLLKIDIAFRENKVAEIQEIHKIADYVKQNNKPLHLIGLVSNGGVHSSMDHLKGLIEVFENMGVKNILLHAFTDGRDTDPKSGKGFIQEINIFLKGKTTRLVSVVGRYYAMDRDKRWERIKIAFDLLVNGVAAASNNLEEAIESSYQNGVTDEFLKPVFLKDAFQPIQPDDAVLCFNFRTDRCRQITRVLTQEDMHEQNMHTLPLHYTTMTNYDNTFKNVNVLFENDTLKNTLGETIANHQLKQIRSAETEKYPHVTFFFNGGREEPFTGEQRILIPSPKVATYDLQPEMSAVPLKDAVNKELEKAEAAFVCVNFANTDMVGHTGVFSAVVKAAETVDTCVQELVTTALQKDYSIFLTADHGNADYMINPDGSPNTAHTKNPVPLFFISNDKQKELKNGKLADLAPTILHEMNINIPLEMSGDILLSDI